MKRLGYSVVAFVFVTMQLGFAQVQGQWTSAGSMQSTRELNAQVRIAGGKVLAIGGFDNNGNILSSVETYSPSSGKWTLTGSMAEARELFPAVVLKNGKVLVAGGYSTSGVLLASAELYDPTTGLWTSAGSMSMARYAHTATLLNNGKVLVAGGCTANGCSAQTAVSELYDPTSNAWTTTGSLSTARAYHSAVALHTGSVLVIGSNAATTACELYNPTTGTWSNAASTNAGRYLHTSALLSDGKVLVAGGANGKFPVSSAEIYDPTANTWTLTGSMTNGRYAHASVQLSDGSVVVAGGVGTGISCGRGCIGYIPFAKAELYSETTGKFTTAASLPQAQAYQTITELTNGRAMVNGGEGLTSVCCVVLNNAYVYTPLTLSFSSTSLSFGLLQVGLTSPAQTVTVTNSSSHSVTFTSIAASGDYAQTNTCPTTMTTGQSCTVTISFTPTAVGTRTGAVTLKDNSPGSPSQTISLTGTGEALALGFTPSSLNLGSVAVGSSSSMTATLTNDGSASVNLTGISISPANNTFTQTNNCPATLSVQQTCTFTIVFTPPDVFTYNATLSVTNSAGTAATLALTGKGLNN